jgi:hypothetical protein
MRTAQQLYEGVDIGSGAVGLITYMRTDSVNLAQEAIAELRDYIAERYGADHLPASRGLQDQVQERPGGARGHPPDLHPQLPKEIKAHLSKDQVQALRADLEAHHRLPDGACADQPGRHRPSAPAPATASAPPAPRSPSPASCRLPGGRDDAKPAPTTTRSACCHR